MITIKFRERKLSHRIRLEIKGHMGLAEEGKDQGCFDASILMYTIAQTVHASAEKHWLVDEPKIELNKGEGIIECRPEHDFYISVLNQFMVVLTGYQIMATKYPDHVRLI